MGNVENRSHTATDTDHNVAMGPGDDRPGRPAIQPAALVIDPEPDSRLRSRDDLTALGYTVTTCPGPLGGVLCSGAGGAGSPRCPRVPADLSLVVMDTRSVRTPLLEAYGQWAPEATLHLGHPHPDPVPA